MPPRRRLRPHRRHPHRRGAVVLVEARRPPDVSTVVLVAVALTAGLLCLH